MCVKLFRNVIKISYSKRQCVSASEDFVSQNSYRGSAPRPCWGISVPPDPLACAVLKFPLQNPLRCAGCEQFAGDELSELESDVSELNSLRLELAGYFCEDEKTFQLDECIRLFSTFFDSFVRACQVHDSVNCTPLCRHPNIF